ncbi:MAG: peptidylprolyl isomerase [Flavobacteriales bacterium]|nr:peptidylprolyl isomerase [Flavobacteriales bacterium]
MRILIAICTFFPLSLFAQIQGELVDKIIGVVGNEIVLHSDLQNAILEMTQGKGGLAPQDECVLIENLMFNKLLLHQSKIDSLEISESDVEVEMERRLARLVGYFGSIEEFEKYYNKTITQLKAEFREDIRDQLLTSKMQAQVTTGVSVTPAQVTEYFNSIPSDSLPLIGVQVQYAQIQLAGEVRESERQRVRNFLDSIRTDIVNGKTTMLLQAAKWSEDPGSRARGGCYDLQSKGTFDPAYEAAVFATQEGGYSPIFESVFGYHFIKTVEKRGNFYEACHILMAPKVAPTDLEKARLRLDSLRGEIVRGSITFEEAASGYSQDEASRNQDGLVLNPSSGGAKFEASEIPATVNLVLDKLQPGELSAPVIAELPDGTFAYVVYKLVSRVEAHKANMENDYLIFKNMAQQELEQEKIFKWTRKKMGETYTQLDPKYKNCGFQFSWATEPIKP